MPYTTINKPNQYFNTQFFGLVIMEMEEHITGLDFNQILFGLNVIIF
jgi:hypothetical protein